MVREKDYYYSMTIVKEPYKEKCEVCGASASVLLIPYPEYKCRFCGFKKIFSKKNHYDNDDLCLAKDVNQYFKTKYNMMMGGETFELSVPVRRFYKEPAPTPDQVNFFKSKNIMFLLEQHGFQMVSRKSRFSTQLSLVVRKV